MENSKKTEKKNTIFIEVVSNGFIVHENYHHQRNFNEPFIEDKKVFNTKKQLFNYISENL